MNLKLGRKYPTKAKLKLSKYLGPALPTPPPACDWTLAMTDVWGMMGNDQLGDCTCAAMGHAVQIVTSNGDGLITPVDAEIIKMYESSGYSPSDPSSDQGWTETAAMQYMVTSGLSNVKADAFADVDQNNRKELLQTVKLMGGAYLGVSITQDDMDQFKAGTPWTSTDMSNVLGGHAIWMPRYDDLGIYVITWGQLQHATWDWYAAHCDEAHAMLFLPWVRNTCGLDPDGFDYDTLHADLASL